MTESKIPPTYEKQFTANQDEAFQALKQARYGGKGLSDPIKTVEVDSTEPVYCALFHLSLINEIF